MKTKKTEKDSETKTTSSELSLQKKSVRKKTKEPSLEFEEEEESIVEETGNSGGELESEEEAEPVIPPVEKKRMETWASDKKKPAFAFKISVPPKWPVKTSRKGESS